MLRPASLATVTPYLLTRGLLVAGQHRVQLRFACAQAFSWVKLPVRVNSGSTSSCAIAWLQQAASQAFTLAREERHTSFEISPPGAPDSASSVWSFKVFANRHVAVHPLCQKRPRNVRILGACTAPTEHVNHGRATAMRFSDLPSCGHARLGNSDFGFQVRITLGQPHQAAQGTGQLTLGRSNACILAGVVEISCVIWIGRGACACSTTASVPAPDGQSP